jgi:hypothetical protein
MSFQAMAWAVDRPCRSAGQKLVLLMLADHANGHTGQCNPSHRRLAEECCMGVSTLKVHLQSLAEDCFIEIIRRQNEGVDLPNQYRLMLPSPGQKLAAGGQNLAGEGSESGRGEGSEAGYKPGIKNQEENQEENQEAPRKRSRKASPADHIGVEDLIQDGLSEEVAQAWIAHRKRKKAGLTPLAWKGIKAEAGKAGWPLQAAIEKALARGWQSFDAAFVERERPAGQSAFAGVI